MLYVTLYRCLTLTLIAPVCYSFTVPTQAGFEVRAYRDYYVQAEKIEWDYLPYKQNLVDDYNVYLTDTLVNGPNRVGSKYSKYVYKQYTDDSFSQEIPLPPSQGYVGPTLRGEVGEIIRVHFRNRIDIPASVHPHGVRYDKNNEGALYQDGTGKGNKYEDAVPPGANVTVTWKLTVDFSPRDGDPNCIPYAYHSHVNPDREVNSGLFGLLLVCKQGILNSAGVRSDVDKEFVLYFDSIDEGESWLVDENLRRCQNPAECQRLRDAEDPDFVESLHKDSINGYMYGNLPMLSACAGQKIAWYLFSLNAELHPVNIFGQTFMYEHHRSSVLGLWSATFRAAEMTAQNVGRWLVSCLNSEHNRNGMKAIFNVNDCHNDTTHDQAPANVRKFYMAAEPYEWDYAPSGWNMYDNESLTAPGSESAKYYESIADGKQRIGRKYKKARFVQYTDGSYSTKVTRSDSEKHLGILGPVIRAEVGDVVEIELINRTPYHPVSIYLQGTSLTRNESGLWLREPFGSYSAMAGKVVSPQSSGTYRFTIPWSVAPGNDDPQCINYLYYSAYNMERDVSSGLVGPLLICKPYTLDKKTGHQKYVDREFFLYFSSVDENFSWFIDDNIVTYIRAIVDKEDEDFVESNIMRSINGRAYGNLEGLEMCKGEQVVWYVTSFGQTEGLHGVTFNGNNLMVDGVHRDSHVSISGLGFTGMMHPDNIGNWSIHCHNDYHFGSGMKAMYHVGTCGDTSLPYFQSNGVVRRYYIAAVERKWNYSPKTIHPLSGENYTDPSSEQYNRIQKDGKFVGSVYTKAIYREFTDATFTIEKPITADTVHLGILGPFIRAEVGDEIEVVFKNMATRSYSMHAQGLRYNKTYEGMGYNDGRPSESGNAVPPGATFVYKWEVPATSGPGPNGPNCVNFMYHSAVNPIKDTYAGLVGPIVICNRGILNADGKRTDSVEREFALLFQAFDENSSWYIGQNIQENCPAADTTTADFEESNKYDSINALVYNNVEGLVATVGDNIAWYIMGLGENEDIHTVHFHGQTYIHRNRQSYEGDVIEVFPGTYETVEMFASNPGTWLFHCHVSEHTRDGMIGTYTIQNRSG